MEERIVYADYNATTPIDKEVKKVFVQALDYYANASSMHEDGRLVAKKIEDARESVATLIGAHPEEIFFTSGGSESNNTVLSLSLSKVLTSTSSFASKYGGRKRVVTSAIEHPCVMESAKYIRDKGVAVDFLPVDSYGVVDVQKFKSILEESEESKDAEKKSSFSFHYDGE